MPATTGPAEFARAGTALAAVVLAPYAMLVPSLVLIGWFEGGSRLVNVVVVPGAALALVLLVPFAFAYHSFASFAYAYDQVALQSLPVDWEAPRWKAVRAVAEAEGIAVAGLSALSVFSRTANLQVVHRPVQAQGVIGRFSDWSMRHRRWFLGTGAAVGLGVSVLNQLHVDLWPGGVGGAVFLVVFFAVAAVIIARTMPRMLRLNIVDPRLVLVIPTQWRTRFRADPAGAEVLLRHELSHVRHRDALRRRLLDPYRNFAPVLAVIETGVVFAARVPTGVQLALLLLAAAAGVTSVRRAYREFSLVQELRADAEAAPDRDRAELLAGTVTELGSAVPSVEQKRRVAALRTATATVTTWRIAAVSAGGFVLPVMVVAGLVLSGVVPGSP